MTMTLHDAPYAPNPFTVRLFIAERGGLTLDVETVDLAHLANREPRSGLPGHQPLRNRSCSRPG